MAGLSVSRLVNVTVNLSPLAAAGRSFGVLMIAGDTVGIINGLERYRSYTSLSAVANDFPSTAPEYLAAQLYFGQTPKPATLMIGRWLRLASFGHNIGGILNAANQLVSAWTSISNGSFIVTIDGVQQAVTGLDFTGVTNLNGVASVITAALPSGVSMVWTGSYFKLSSGTQGAGVQASGTITFSGVPAANGTVVINGTTVTFVASAPTGNQVLIGTNAAQTAANLQAFLQTSTDANLSLLTYATVGPVVTMTAKVSGLAGNAYTLAKTATNVAISSATLAGGLVPSAVGFMTAGTTTDISGMLAMTAASAQALVPGYAAESPLQCAQALASISTGWYGLMFAASTMPTPAQNLAVAPFIEACALTRMFGVTTQDTSVLSALVTNDIASLLMAGSFKQTCVQYSSSSPYAIASLFGRAFSVDFTANRSVITLMYKQEPLITAESLTDSQATTLQSKRCNVFALYVNGTYILQYGVMSGPAYFDETHGLDWFQDAVQTACFNVLYQTTTKVPQTDQGANQLTSAVQTVCDAAVNNGLAAPGTWTADGFGALTNGQFLKSGYYIYCAPMSSQSASDRAARIAPPIQVALKLAGAIHTMNVIVNVNR